MNTIKNYYHILNIAPGADNEQIKSAFRNLIKFWHPDINNSPDAHVRTIEIKEAYEILSNPQKRKVYDRLYFVFFGPESYAEQEQAESFFQDHEADQPSEPEDRHSENKESTFQYSGFSEARYREYKFDNSTYEDFDLIQKWVKEAANKGEEIVRAGLKKADRSLETGFFIVGEVWNFLAMVFGVALVIGIAINIIVFILELLGIL